MASGLKFALILSAGVLAGSAAVTAALSGSYVVPLDDEAIRYASRAGDDPVQRLNQKIASGELKLRFDDTHGYLRSVLAALQIPIESQVLVFSKTSFQAANISPSEPRALYFNDSTAVGAVHGSDILEFASVDPRLGVVFYTLDQRQTDKPHFDRRDTECLACHDSGGTLGVPGLVARSVYPDPSGMPVFKAGDYINDHRSPLPERWGGWYVTGTHGGMTHMGNAVVRNPQQPDQLDGARGLNLTDLKGKFDTADYLTPHSDIVALMVLAHQTRMTNLITRVSYETYMALESQARINQAFHQPMDEMSDSTRHRIDSAAEEMVQYMLFLDEAKLDAPIQGTAGFAEAFEKAGPHDRQGRGLRDLDMKTRMFRYPLSYMIYSEAFDSMPAAAHDRIYQLLFNVLSGKEKSNGFARLSDADRRAIFEIVSDTKKDLPAYWKTALAAR